MFGRIVQAITGLPEMFAAEVVTIIVQLETYAVEVVITGPVEMCVTKKAAVIDQAVEIHHAREVTMNVQMQV